MARIPHDSGRQLVVIAESEGIYHHLRRCLHIPYFALLGTGVHEVGS